MVPYVNKKDKISFLPIFTPAINILFSKSQALKLTNICQCAKGREERRKDTSRKYTATHYSVL